MLLRKPYRVVVLRQLGGIGDLLMLTPVLRGLKEKYGGRRCELTVATTWEYGAMALPDLLRGNPWVDRVVRVEPTEFATGMLRAHKHKYLNVPRDRVPDCVQRADLVCDLNVCCMLYENATQPRVDLHRTEIWGQRAGLTAGEMPLDCRPVLRLQPSELAAGARWCEEHLGSGVRVGVGLCAVDPFREWPHADDFTRLLFNKGYKAVTVSENRRVEGVTAVIGKRIRETAAILAHLDAFVTPDTGLLHVAGAMGVPLLGVFGSTDPLMRMRYYCGSYVRPEKIARCAPCWYGKPCVTVHENAYRQQSLVPTPGWGVEPTGCLKRLEPELVLAGLEELLVRHRRPGKA